MNVPRAVAMLLQDLEASADPAKARVLAGFFKTGPGEYGEGDQFLGIPVPVLRRIARTHVGLSLPGLRVLLGRPEHEARSCAWMILVERHKAADAAGREELHRFALANLRRANNWDLVDLSMPQLLGESLAGHPDRTQILLELAGSENLWERRSAIVATYAFLRKGDHGPTLAIAEHLLADPEDLIHKASGWMLREMGKHGGERELLGFLRRHAARMPRTMLRQAIERMDPDERAYWRAVPRAPGIRREPGKGR